MFKILRKTTSMTFCVYERGARFTCSVHSSSCDLHQSKLILSRYSSMILLNAIKYRFLRGKFLLFPFSELPQIAVRVQLGKLKSTTPCKGESTAKIKTYKYTEQHGIVLLTMIYRWANLQQSGAFYYVGFIRYD